MRGDVSCDLTAVSGMGCIRTNLMYIGQILNNYRGSKYFKHDQ